MKVGVLTVTKRTGWEKIAQTSLENQTYKDFDYVVVHEPNVPVSEDLPLARYVKAPKKKRISNLSASNNEGLKQFIGYDYVIFYQDFIELPPDCIEKLIAAAEETRGFVSTMTINPDGTLDGRYIGADLLRPCEPAEWEENVAIAPMRGLEILGGYDEEYDDGWAWNNCNVAERAKLLNYPFCIDESIKPTLHYHPKEPDLNKKLRLNGDFHAERMALTRDGKFPLRLHYL